MSVLFVYVQNVLSLRHKNGDILLQFDTKHQLNLIWQLEVSERQSNRSSMTSLRVAPCITPHFLCLRLFYFFVSTHLLPSRRAAAVWRSVHTPPQTPSPGRFLIQLEMQKRWGAQSKTWAIPYRTVRPALSLYSTPASCARAGAAQRSRTSDLSIIFLLLLLIIIIIFLLLLPNSQSEIQLTSHRILFVN